MYTSERRQSVEGGHQSPLQAHPHPHAYSPTHARARSSSYPVPPSPSHQQQRSVPTSPTSARRPPPQSPTTRERPTSSYYDPTSEARAGTRESVNASPYQPKAPLTQRREPPYEYGETPLPPPPQYIHSQYQDQRPGSGHQHQTQSSPAPPHAHPAPTADARPQNAPYDPVRQNSGHSHAASRERPPLAQPGERPQMKTNPMAMMNLLAEKPPLTARPNESPLTAQIRGMVEENHRKWGWPRTVEEAKDFGKTPGGPAGPSSMQQESTDPSHSTPKSVRMPPPPAPQYQPPLPLPPPPPIQQQKPPPPTPPTPSQSQPYSVPQQTGPPSLTIKDTEAAYKEIEARDLSDVEADVPGMEGPKKDYAQRMRKRTLEIEITESMKRKRRRKDLMNKYFETFSDAAEAERQAFIEVHENEVAEEVRTKEIEEDKERKKDQQRKRRREKAIADEQVKRDEAVQKLASVQDEEERAGIEKDIQRYDKKIRDTQSRLQGITPTKEFRHESPHNAALGRREREVPMEGGLMTSFYSTNGNHDEGTPELAAGGRVRNRGGRSGVNAGRARKSKEQKQAEKDNAARGQAYIDQGQDLPPLAPKEEERLQGYASRRMIDREDSEPLSDVTPAAFDMQPTAGLTGMAKFESKGYHQIYEQISRDIAKGVPKVVRIKNNSLDTKQSNARKTAQLASKEARRWQARTNKSTKDVAARAKRAMREMLGFWKRNERDEREGRKAAERQEMDKARKAEAEREANRQKRKLNFLISQTELYSHFIGKKVKTDEIEKSGVDGDGVAPTAETIKDDPSAMPDPSGKLASKVTNFEDLDFDAEDETALKEAAMANAQHAIKEAQDRARAFNNDKEGETDLDRVQENFDEGELNFQNPTSLQSMDVAQPKMLDCQLKEYQLKGLNWLVNLYEQGINGILADEMGLGKTVQSISVMAYLAEVHNIWGPFLVIAPASTLHNWQQEITRFVPDIKVLPYWGSAKDRKILRKFWDRKHITYNRESPFHVLVTSYQLVVQDTAYFQKVKWQYMILDEAQAIKSSQSSRWKSLLGFHCRNRLLLTGTPIQNNMQELWALLHFIMPSLFDSHDEFSEWFSKDIENHAQSNTKLNEDQLRRLHMILKPFMLRRIKKHVQKELGDKIEEDVFCDLTYRQRAYYTNLRNKISILDLIEKAAVGDDQDTATLMNLVMQFRKVCNHPDLFERAETLSPFSMSSFAETASFMREGHFVNVAYSARSLIEYWLPSMLGEGDGRLDIAGPENARAGWRAKSLNSDLSVWDERHVQRSSRENGMFSWLRFIDQSAGDVAATARKGLYQRAIDLISDKDRLGRLKVAYDDDDEQENSGYTPAHSMLNIVKRNERKPLAEVTNDGILNKLMNVSQLAMEEKGYDVIETCYFPGASAPPAELVCLSYKSMVETETTFFNVPIRRTLYPISIGTEATLLQSKLPPSKYPATNLLPEPASAKQRYTKIQVPSMRRFVTDSGKLARLDQLLRQLKEGGHRVLLYFQMTRMIDLMEEYLTYRNYKYCRLDGSTKLEDRRDTVAAFQSSPDLFVFLLSTRAGGLGINLTSADTVIFYDSDWNPTIDSQAMDRAHRLGQTRQVTVYRLITRGTIEERIRKRALQKEEVQRVVISGQAGGDKVVDFNNRSRETNRTKEMAMWLADDDQAAAIERREMEVIEEEAKAGGKRKRKGGAGAAGGKRKEVSMDEMYHEGEGKFEDASHEASGAATPMSAPDGPPAKKKGLSKKAKTVKQRLAVIDGEVG